VGLHQYTSINEKGLISGRCYSLNLRIAMRVLLKRANLVFVLVYVMIDACGFFSFVYFSASPLLALVHSSAIPPLIHGEKLRSPDLANNWLTSRTG